ncbi:MAG: response regulator [Magnetococcales bacterium]|nr:response regulator [Magnetococcales bacterium]
MPTPKPPSPLATFPIRSGLGRTVFLWLLGLSLLPLGFISWLGYSKSVEALRTETSQKLSIAVALKYTAMEMLFTEQLLHLQRESLSQARLHLITDLGNAWRASTLPAEAFVKSHSWTQRVEKEGRDIAEFVATYGYKNYFLMEPGGTVLFSHHPDPLLGSNLLAGTEKTLLLGESVQKALENKKAVFSDLQPNRVMAQSGYLIQPMLGENGQVTGVIILEISLAPLFQLMETNVGLGVTGETYLVGSDLKMRSPSRVIKQTVASDVRVDTWLSRQWLQSTPPGQAIHGQVTTHDTSQKAQTENQPMSVTYETYTDYDGHEVLGTYKDLHFMADLGVHWGLFAEMEAREFFAPSSRLRNQLVIVLILVSVLVLLVAGRVAGHIVTPVQRLTQWSRKIQEGEWVMESIAAPNNEVGLLVHAFEKMAATLIAVHENKLRTSWMEQGAAELNRRLRGEKELGELAAETVSFLASWLDCPIGALYVIQSDGGVMLYGHFALSLETRLQNVTFKPGEGLVGQCLVNKTPMRIHPLPAEYFRIQSGLGESQPGYLLLFPFMVHDKVEAIVELGAFAAFNDHHLEFLAQEAISIAMAVAAANSRTLLQQALAHSQKQAEALEKIGAEMQRSNQELQEKTRELQASEATLLQQQEELRVSNEALAINAQQLEEQNVADQKKNLALQAIRKELEQKAFDLEQANRYKSQFLSNMSHELRTPLNSLLILANNFCENHEGNLTPQQVEDATIIHNSGRDLLGLINEILDLAKIEAGRMDCLIETMSIHEFALTMEQNFRHVARKKGLTFQIADPAADCPKTLSTDWDKVSRIIKNLLANAFKFTQQGGVTLEFAPLPGNFRVGKAPTDIPVTGVAISVRDTGIGIPPEKHATIFEAFQQADGSTSRKFGGTGLGLTISMQLAQLLGGTINLVSREGVGSIFTLLLPWLEANASATTTSSPPPLPQPNGTRPMPRTATDNRPDILTGDRVVLIVEDDPQFANLVAQIAGEKGFKTLMATDGQSGLELALNHIPSGIILDIGLPVMDGWAVLECLKSNPATSAIPVHILSGADHGVNGIAKGATSHLSKPVSKADIQKILASTPHQAEDVTLFLHRVNQDLPPGVDKKGARLHDPKEVFKNKTILVVDDDMRNTRVLARMLERKELRVLTAGTGKEALEVMAEHPEIDAVLMDIMMPVMDGFEAMRCIRQNPMYPNLPIIALTAKAMEEDRKQCLSAGANDFLAKPVDMNKLLAMLQVWLYQ